jgi:metal-responsive CopG/Arc/MetJ family transcriptional regulator
MKIDAMEKIMITIPKDLIHDIDKFTKNRSEFIRESVKERLKKEKEQQMIEGYKKEKNLVEWEATSGEGIE